MSSEEDDDEDDDEEVITASSSSSSSSGASDDDDDGEESDASSSSSPFEGFTTRYDEYGRRLERATVVGRASSALHSDSSHPRRLVVELTRCRNLGVKSRSRRRGRRAGGSSASRRRMDPYGTCELAPKEEGVERLTRTRAGMFTAYETSTVAYAAERQRQCGEVGKLRRASRGRRGVGGGLREYEFKTKFVLYASQTLTDDVVRVSIRDKRRRKDGCLGVVEIPVNRLFAESGGLGMSRSSWFKLNYEENVPEDFGKFRWKAFFDATRPGVLHAHVLSASGIKASDMNGFSDPYVKVKLVRRGESVEHLEAVKSARRRAWENPHLDEEFALEHAREPKDAFSTEKLQKTLDPVWQRGEFEFREIDRASESFVLFELWDHDLVGEDDLLSQYSVRVREIKAARPSDPHAAERETKWRKPTKNVEILGKINVVAYFEDDAQTELRIIVRRAVGMGVGNLSGDSNPFVVVSHGDYSTKTSAKTSTNVPIWNHAIAFKAANDNESQNRRRQDSVSCVTFDVFHQRQNKNIFMGRASLALQRIAKKSQGGAKRSHWLALGPSNTVANVAEVRLKMYFESESPATRPREEIEDVFARMSFDATADRARRWRKETKISVKKNANERAMEIHNRLESLIANRLRQFKWPEALVPAYARAYAACCDDPALLPPPPDDSVIPFDIVRMFEAAAFSRCEDKSHGIGSTRRLELLDNNV